MTNKASSGLFALRRAKRSITNNQTLISIYNSLILPYFDYCSPVWDSIGTTLSNNLQKLQNRSARIITGYNYDTRSSTILKELKWLPLHQRRSIHRGTMLFKSLNNLAPIYMKNMFSKRSSTHSFKLRSHKYNLTLPKPKTEYAKRSFSYKGATLWNNLPNELKCITSLHSFSKS